MKSFLNVAPPVNIRDREALERVRRRLRECDRKLYNAMMERAKLKEGEKHGE